jgi:hypothetical protein
MHLEGSGGRFQHHIFMPEAEPVTPGDVHLQGLATAQAGQLLIQRLVTLHVGHVCGV